MKNNSVKSFALLRIKTITFIIVLYVVATAAILWTVNGMHDRNVDTSLKETITVIESSLDRQKEITDAVKKISALTAKKGYELDVSRVLRDHAGNMSAIKENLSELKNLREKKRDGSAVAIIVIILLVHGMIFIFYFMRLTDSIPRKIVDKNTDTPVNSKAKQTGKVKRTV